MSLELHRALEEFKKFSEIMGRKGIYLSDKDKEELEKMPKSKARKLILEKLKKEL